MRLQDFSVHGFRSLANVEEIPVGAPTVLTGENGGGKSATIDALAFLLDGSTLADADRTTEQANTSNIQIAGNRIAFLKQDGTLYMKEGIGGYWYVMETGVNDYRIS